MIILNTKRTAHKSNRTIQYCWCYFGLFFDIPSPWETFSNHPFNKMYHSTSWHDTLCDSQVLIWKYQQQKTFPEWNMIQRTLFGKTDMSPGVRDFTKRFWSIPQTNIVFNCKKMKWIPDSALLLHDNISIKNNFLFFFKNRNAQRCLTLFLWSQTPVLFRTSNKPQTTSIKVSSCLTWPSSSVEINKLLYLDVLNIIVHFIWSWWEHYLCLEC